MSQYSGGDSSLRNLRKSFGAKRQAASDTAAGVEARQEARVATQTAAEEAIEQLAAAYERCAEACVCGAHPCPLKGMKRCPT